MRISVFGDIADWNMETFSIARIPEVYRNIITESDYAVFNLEGPVIHENSGYRFQISQNRFNDRVFKSLLNVLNKKQPEVCSSKNILNLLRLNKNLIFTLANNHVKDRGIAGLRDCLSILESHGVKFLGAGLTKEAANQHLCVRGDECNLYILNYNFVGLRKGGFLNIYGASENDFGAAYLNYQGINEKVKQIRKDPHAFILLILHAGKCMVRDIDALKINFQKLLQIDAQVKVVHHMHRHYKSHLKDIYLLGDFIFSSPNLTEKRNGSFLQISIHSAGSYHVNQIGGYQFQDGYPVPLI